MDDQLLCKRCKKRHPLENRTACGICLEKQRLVTAARRKVLKENKLCDNCGIRQRRDEGVYCHVCLANNKIKRKNRKAEGRCTGCGGYARLNKFTCEKCGKYAKDMQTKNQNKRKKSGMCIVCGKNCTEEPHVKCNACLLQQCSKWQKRSNLLEFKGLCVKCGQREPLKKNKQCEICYLKAIATKRIGSSAKWRILKDLYEQQKGICPYTGREIKIGTDADLDHKIACSKGGSNDPSNLQWVHRIVNQMKWNNDESEFFMIIQEIHNYRLS